MVFFLFIQILIKYIHYFFISIETKKYFEITITDQNGFSLIIKLIVLFLFASSISSSNKINKIKN